MGIKQSKPTISYVAAPEQKVIRSNTPSTIPAKLKYYANTTTDKEAVIFVSTDEERDVVTYKELYEKSARTARALVHLGVRRHEFVAVNVRSCPEWMYVTFGTMMAGACPISVSFTYKDGSDLIGMMEKLAVCSCLVFDPGYENESWIILSKLIDEYSSSGFVASKRMPFLRYLIYHDKSANIKEMKSVGQLLETELLNIRLPEIGENDVAMLFQTSGSTGIPKAVVLTHKSLLAAPKWMDQGPVLSSQDRLFCDRPMGWFGGFPFSLLIGQTRVTVSGFCAPPRDLVSFLFDAIRKEKCKSLMVLPHMLHDMIQRKDERAENWPLKTVLTGGQPLMRHTIACIGTLCKYLITGYGATECSYSIGDVISDPEDFVDFCSGYAIAGTEIKIMSSDGMTVPLNTRGEIYVRSSGVFQRYLNDQEKTRSVLTDDGWYKTVDVGVMMEDGSIRVEGRISNTIITRGINVAPEILENLIQKCPGVHAAIVVPVPDDVLYQVICACVTVVSGHTLDGKDIPKFCEEAHGDKLGLFTVLPKYYMILERFPETKTGKTSRAELSRMAKEMFSNK